MRSKAIVRCLVCGQDKWRFADATYVRALLEEGDEDLTGDKGVVKISCGNCGHVALFDAKTVGIRGSWAQGRDL
jgi:ribosomal protein S27E